VNRPMQLAPGPLPDCGRAPCGCADPDDPICPRLPIEAILNARTVREMSRVFREHRATCELCGPVKIRKTGKPERAKPAKREAAWFIVSLACSLMSIVFVWINKWEAAIYFLLASEICYQRFKEAA
jgi:hypothetical protein